MPLGQMHYRRKCYSAWLGIAAILMLFIAPVVSSSLALSYDQNTAAMSEADCATEMAHHDNQTAQTTHTGQHEATHNDMMMGHAACGYCVLLIHLPLLNTAFKADIRTVLLLAEVSPSSFIYSKIIDDTYSENQPRAPPFFYS
ncbi:DUF2946 domain-containing protein [Yersinia aldovae]|uniref:DUF2946 domain-containing protein n=1 Tax=Yersinia aldovae TaxID=29483 RepID=UPI00066FEAEB|nr:DUF2946 domain-containing protein [Yersinia aldovae]